MAADERRRKILEALSVRRHETCDNLAFEFGVSVRTIYNDLLHLSKEYPIYTSQGHKGGVSMMDGYYINRKSLTDKQTELLTRLASGLTGEDKKTMEEILKMFGKGREVKR